MRLFLIATLAFLTAATPLAAAGAPAIAAPDLEQGPCLIYPMTINQGPTWVGTRDTTIYGRDVDVLFVHVSTDDVTITRAGTYTPPVYAETPGICYGYAGELIAIFA